MRTVRCLGALIVALLASSIHADVRVAPVFSDQMVLQRGRPVPVWGTADAGESIDIRCGDKTAHATTDASGHWRADLPAMEAGGPFRLDVRGKTERRFSDVLIGDVWLCSGQSNMDFRTIDAKDGAAEVAAATYPNIRLLPVPIHPTAQPETGGDLKWRACTPTNVRDFSAVGYFFGRDLHQQLNVPIGLIRSSVGGTPSESWTPREDLLADPVTAKIVTAFDKVLAEYPRLKQEYAPSVAAWQSAVMDPADSLAWAATSFDDSAWPVMKMPIAWQKAGLPGNGIVYFRRSVTVPSEWAGKDLTIELGPIDDYDTTFFNGEKIGGVGPDNTLAPFVARKYTIPAKLVHAGSNSITVRIVDTGGDGGMIGQPQQMKLSPVGASAEPIALSGDWKCSRWKSATDLPKRAPEPLAPGNAWTPGALWNGMVNPLVPYAIRGVIWYQGESNGERAIEYRTAFPLMISAWRKAWGQGDLPFYFVQIANFSLWHPRDPEPVDSRWAELREAQAMTLKLPQTGMAVAIDIGDNADIHPKDKQSVGKRLALCALAGTYGKSIAFEGPKFESMTVEGSAVRLKFSNGPLVKIGSGEKCFAVAGEDRKFHWADVTVNENDVIVKSAAVPAPVAVRYAWADDPEHCLGNAAGLPAGPFRTDDWPGTTAGKTWEPGK